MEFHDSGAICNPSLVSKMTFSIVLFKTMENVPSLLIFTWQLWTTVQLNTRKADEVKLGVCIYSKSYCLHVGINWWSFRHRYILWLSGERNVRKQEYRVT